MHGSGKLVKSDCGKSDNLSKISSKVCSYSLNSCKFKLLTIVLLEEKEQFKFGVVMTGHHMKFLAMYLLFLFALE